MGIADKLRGIKPEAAPVTLVARFDDANAEFNNAILDNIKAHADQEKTNITIEALNREYFVAPEGGKVRIWREVLDPEFGHQTVVPMTRDDFSLALENKRVVVTDVAGNSRAVPLAKAWLSATNRREYLGGIVMRPDDKVPEGAYNLWRGFSVKAVEGNAEPMVAHVLALCDGEQEIADYVIGWCASAVQHMDRPTESAIVLRGGRGVGKGTLGRAMRSIFGAHGMQITQSKHLVGNFNSHLRTTLFLFADEAFFAGDRAGEGTLKGLITEDCIAIEGKGRDVITVRNRLKIMMASNNDWVVPAGLDERRFLVLDVPNTHQGDKDYFDRLNQWLHRENGLGIWLHYLMNYDLTDFDTRRVPSTGGLEQQKLLSLEPVAAWMYGQLYEGLMVEYDRNAPVWKREQSKDAMASSFTEFIRNSGKRHVSTDTVSIGKHLHKIFPSMTSARRGTAGRNRVWVFPELDAARQEFSEYAGIKHTGWPQE